MFVEEEIIMCDQGCFRYAAQITDISPSHHVPYFGSPYASFEIKIDFCNEIIYTIEP